MNSARIQHLVPATTILALGIWVAWISFTQQPSSAFLFPRLISVIMVLLAAWNFARAALGFAKAGAGFYAYEIRNILPGIVIAAIYVFFAAKMLGFYVSSIATFLIIYSMYDPVPLLSARDWIKRGVVTISFIAVIYILFALILQVQTPRGLFL